MRPLELLKDDCDPATPFEPSLVPCALSAFFLLLKRNAIVPFEAGNLLCYANLPQGAADTRDIPEIFFVWSGKFEVPVEVGQEILSERPRVRLEMAGDLRSAVS
jgi:hypothetical protein